jgi:nitrite reductase/ring-hydroxylating ferredoxin subunit
MPAMKNSYYLIFTCLIMFSCGNDDDVRNRNPYLLDVNFNQQLTPIQSQDLEFPSNSVYVANAGIRGVHVINTGSGLIAWEASDPNHTPNDCSRTVRTGVEVSCQCDDANTYNLFTGQSSGTVLEFTLLQYRVRRDGDIVTISN